ncbi:sigma factor-like helix-turn-helix DNA-binding protein [Paenibacillus periandrae]|uniref:sigma factor-like helix-turn-helix DNA-binding protein n=1 Tax=Paenibacillus periandrae TaxID=1761741 RepID=UPI003B839881
MKQLTCIIVGGGYAGINAIQAIHKDLLSYAMLVLLERLSPSERTVFVLREALCFDYADIADLIGKSEINCRKLISRAREKMGIDQHASVPAEGASEEWVGRFLHTEHNMIRGVYFIRNPDKLRLIEASYK